MTKPVYSPIALLDDAIASAAFAIAPEKATELANDPRVAEFGLVLSADSGCTIRVDIDTKEATLPVFAMEYLWCFSFLVLALVEEYQGAQSGGKETIDLRTSPQVSQAVDMLNWSHARMRQGGGSPWPEEFPKPEKNPAQSDIAYSVNQIFLSAIAWIIHHEIAHIRLGHGIETTYSVQEETAADDEATKRIFSENLNDDVLLKRQLGMAVALLSLQFLEEPQGKDSRVESHPPSVDRLFRCFDIAGVAQDGFICALTTVALQFQLANLDIKTPLDGNSWSNIMADALISFTTAGRD
ncbi:phage exclusion protein Lit family protein [Bordetella tumulicola]|uniref:phage exclusion protein Lit family protein n=1 Tax=Bordetella tumulicola TaxID=1649133 RepID=UPI0039F0C188